VSHSLWIVRNNLDPDSVNCGGVGATLQRDPLLYQRFRCRIRHAVAYQLWFLYELKITGRDTFVMKKLAQGLSS
jgi:hypothetical protein